MKKHIRGLSMIELLVALAIGSILIAGAVFVYSQTRSAYAVSETLARLQENARYAMSVVEADLQLAGYYGFSNSPEDLNFISGGSLASPTPASRMTRTSAALTGLDASAQTCGNNFAVNVMQTVEGSENSYGLTAGTCNALGGGYRATTDRLTIRRSSIEPVDATAGRVQMLANRLSSTNQYLFDDGVVPSTPEEKADLIEVRDLVVRSYYISLNSDSLPNVPALRLKALVSGAGGPSFSGTDALTGLPADMEVMSGVEDLQIQFGIDTGSYDGDANVDAGQDVDGNGIPDAPNGIATRYVNADFANIERYQVVSVRIWLMLRAPAAELGFVDGNTYEYANKTVTPNDAFRRVLVSKTIQLRNARTF